MDTEIRYPNITSTLQLTGYTLGTKPPGWDYPRHHHYLFELLHCREGEAQMSVGDDRFVLRAGQWLLIRASVPHGMMNASDALYVYLNVHFDVDDPQLRAGLCQTPYQLIDSESALALGIQPHGDAIEQALRDSSGDVAAEHPYAQAVRSLLVQAHTLQLAAAFAARSMKEEAVMQPGQETAPAVGSGAGVSAGSTTLARTIEEKLRSAPPGDFSIAQIASALGISPGRCTTAFSDVYGLSPRQYRSRLVLNEAKHLLVTTDLPISEVAERLGFQSVSHFSRQFRRWTGMAPTAYRPKYWG